jgi:hypothetical protein
LRTTTPTKANGYVITKYNYSAKWVFNVREVLDKLPAMIHGQAYYAILLCVTSEFVEQL